MATSTAPTPPPPAASKPPPPPVVSASPPPLVYPRIVPVIHGVCSTARSAEDEWSIGHFDGDAAVALGDLLSKYEMLVWYARKPRGEAGITKRAIRDHYGPEMRGDTVASILAAGQQVERQWPAETAALNGTDERPDPSWSHGFNTGVLMALRAMSLSLDAPPNVSVCAEDKWSGDT
jgi:hypothetical protein